MQDKNLKSQECLAIFAGRGNLPQILLDDLVKKIVILFYFYLLARITKLIIRALIQ